MGRATDWGEAAPIMSAEQSVEQLVDSVLTAVPASLRETSDRAGILEGLQCAGAESVPLLRTLFEQDYAEVKAAIGSAAKAAFVAMLKEAVMKPSAPPPPGTPATPGFNTPQGPHADAGALSRVRNDRALGQNLSDSSRVLASDPARATNSSRKIEPKRCLHAKMRSS